MEIVPFPPERGRRIEAFGSAGCLHVRSAETGAGRDAGGRTGRVSGAGAAGAIGPGGAAPRRGEEQETSAGQGLAGVLVEAKRIEPLA